MHIDTENMIEDPLTEVLYVEVFKITVLLYVWLILLIYLNSGNCISLIFTFVYDINVIFFICACHSYKET